MKEAIDRLEVCFFFFLSNFNYCRHSFRTLFITFSVSFLRSERSKRFSGCVAGIGEWTISCWATGRASQRFNWIASGNSSVINQSKFNMCFVSLSPEGFFFSLLVHFPFGLNVSMWTAWMRKETIFVYSFIIYTSPSEKTRKFFCRDLIGCLFLLFMHFRMKLRISSRQWPIWKKRFSTKVMNDCVMWMKFWKIAKQE